jgi:hypothetical protein
MKIERTIVTPNASLLTILSIPNKKTKDENILFAYLKELEEVAPELHWYKGRGENGKSNFIWQEKNIKEWSLIGSDDELLFIWNKLVSEQTYSHTFISKTIVFKIPALSEKIEKNNFVAIEGIKVCEKKESPKKYIFSKPLMTIDFLLNEQNNCNFIEGYKHHDKINPIRPFGLFSENLLFNNLKEKICAIHERRGLHWQLSGDRNNVDSDGNTKRLYGFIQGSNAFKTEVSIRIRSIDGTETLGEAAVEIETGRWETNLSEGASKGQFILENKITGQFICGQKYYLLKDIKINTEIANRIIDLYKREIQFTSTPKKGKLIKESIIWDVKSAPDGQQSELELSDRLLSVLLSMGNKIIFNDPYFFGDFKIEQDNIKTISKSQYVFLNALITAMIQGQIEELTIIGNWQIAKKFVDGDKELFYTKYKLLLKMFKRIFKNSTYFKLKKFEIIFSKQHFHDRYWLSDEESNSTIYHVSNSINGIFESGELRIIPTEDLDIFKINPKISSRIELGEKLNLI